MTTQGGLTSVAPMPASEAIDSDGTWATFEAEALPHIDRLFRLAMWFERNRPEAEDLVQETMMQALRSFHRFQPGTNCESGADSCRHWFGTSYLMIGRMGISRDDLRFSSDFIWT